MSISKNPRSRNLALTASPKAVARWLERRAELSDRIVISGTLARWLAAIVRRVAGLSEAA